MTEKKKPTPPRLNAKQAKEQADKRKRNAMGYSDSDPRCANCKHYKCSIGYENLAQRQIRKDIICRLGDFKVNPHGCCNQWKSATGEVLEKVAVP